MSSHGNNAGAVLIFLLGLVLCVLGYIAWPHDHAMSIAIGATGFLAIVAVAVVVAGQWRLEKLEGEILIARYLRRD